MNLESEILETVGISSKVFRGDNFLGHILLLDYDHMEKVRVLRNIAELPGISILRPSSATGWHVWNLTIRTRDETGLLGLKMWSDALHHAVSYQRSNWILRIGPKLDQKNSEYKPAPGNIEVFSNDTLQAQSLPHLQILKTRFQYRFTKIENRFQFAGDRTLLETYMTVSDELKKEL